jgi:hypothetical protein
VYLFRIEVASGHWIDVDCKQQRAESIVGVYTSKKFTVIRNNLSARSNLMLECHTKCVAREGSSEGRSEPQSIAIFGLSANPPTGDEVVISGCNASRSNRIITIP